MFLPLYYIVCILYRKIAIFVKGIPWKTDIGTHFIRFFFIINIFVKIAGILLSN